MIEFKIRLRNELRGTNITLFTGKAKVGKFHDEVVKLPKFANHFTYYVDHDWNMQIGYLFIEDYHGLRHVPPVLKAALWFRGDDVVALSGHLFYQGKQVGKDSCANAEVTNSPSSISDAAGKYKWTRVRCTFIHVFQDTKPEGFSQDTPLYVLAGNPGDYEMKVLWKGRLARMVKFTVTADGKFDNGIASANKLGNERVIVPVQVVGDQDGVWDRTAWKTGAFYGNLLTGFSAPQ